MKKSPMSLTLVEVAVILFIVAVMVVVVVHLARLGRPTPSLKGSCKSTCRQVGYLIDMYRQNYGGFYPFAWCPADVDPSGSIRGEYHSGARGDRPKHALASLGCLYTDYLFGHKIFKCPATENAPYLTVQWPTDLWDAGGNTSDAARELGKNPKYKYLWNQRNWQLHDTSYGYDCRITPAAVSTHAIFGDMDGSWAVNPDTSMQNHAGGNHILYVDCHVEFRPDNYCSREPLDNVYIEDPWHADTDSYISDNADPKNPDNRAADVFGLSASYDAYENLKP